MIFGPRALGPGSLLWEFAGDKRLAFTGLSTGILQLMHPGIGAGVVEHSAFFSEPWERIERSLPQILGVIFDRDPELTGRRVRNFHRSIKGIDEFGRRYNALEPGTFWFAHATFQDAVHRLVDEFDRRSLGPAEKEELYLDGVEWYRRYGMSMRCVPPDYGSFSDRWAHYCEEVLQLSPAAEHAISIALGGTNEGLPWLPRWSTWLQRLTVLPILRLTAIGGIPEVVRRRFGIPWPLADEVAYQSFQLAVRQAWPLMPAERRFIPKAAAATARVRADGDLEETPPLTVVA